MGRAAGCGARDASRHSQAAANRSPRPGPVPCHGMAAVLGRGAEDFAHTQRGEQHQRNAELPALQCPHSRLDGPDNIAAVRAVSLADHFAAFGGSPTAQAARQWAGANDDVCVNREHDRRNHVQGVHDPAAVSGDAETQTPAGGSVEDAQQPA